MCFFISFLPATIWAVIGYLVLFSSTRAEGFVRKLGQWLAIWAFIISGLILIAGAVVSVSGVCPIDALMQGTN